MPEANQYVFDNKELLGLLIRQAGVHEGRWSLVVNFGVGPVMAGPNPEAAAPGLSVIIASVGIQKVLDDAPQHGTLDAAVVNPKSPKAKKVS